jgi:hypothetical protein
MFAARVPQYESTTNVRIESSHAMAYFPPEALGRMQADQPAIVRFDNEAFPARVQTVAADHAELVLDTSHQSPITASTSATAEVEVSRLSPAAIALRTLR